MSADSKIEWTDHTFNTWWGCARVSSGCRNCYADTLASRWGHELWRRHGPRKSMADAYWRGPVKWNKAGPARVFCGSMCDVFETHPEPDVQAMQDAARARLWDLIEATPNLTWQLLTKRPENILGMVPWRDRWPQNVWTGTSVEDQKAANRRVPLLLRVPGVLFLSCEPLISPVDLSPWLGGDSCGCMPEPGGRHLPGDRVGGSHDRLRGSNLAGRYPEGRPLGRSSEGDPLPAAPGGEDVGEVLPSPGDVQWTSDSCTGASTGLETLQRVNPIQLDGEPQEREVHGQSSGQLGVSDSGAAGHACSHSSPAWSAGSTWDAQRDGEADHRTSARDSPTESGRRVTACSRCGLGGARADDLQDRARRAAISWIIIGGESGAGARPMALSWAQSLVDQCRDADVPAFVKQIGTIAAGGGKGGDMSTWPVGLRVREFPEVRS